MSTLATGTPQVVAAGGCVTLSATTGLALPIIEKSLDEDNFSWRASLNWKATPDILLYANATKGYKAGSFPTLPGAVDDQFTPVRQESVQAYEIGGKFSLMNRRLQIDGAAFHYDYDDKQLLGFRVVQPFGPLPGLVSIPKSRVSGFEINAQLQPAEGLTLSLGGTYLDTKVKADPANPTGAFGTSGSFVGQSFPFTPRWQGVADAEYRFGISSSAELFLGGTGAGRSGTKGALLNGTGAAAVAEQALLIPGYALLDLRLGVEDADRKWRVEIWGRNVTDRYYMTNATRVADWVLRFAGYPASCGVTVKFRM